MMCHDGFWQGTSFCQHSMSSLKSKLLSKHLIGLHVNHSYLVSQLSSANTTPLGFDMPSGYSVEEMCAESVIIKTLGSEKNGVSLMMAVSADGVELLLHVILKYNAMPKKQLPTR